MSDNDRGFGRYSTAAKTAEAERIEKTAQAKGSVDLSDEQGPKSPLKAEAERARWNADRGFGKYLDDGRLPEPAQADDEQESGTE